MSRFDRLYEGAVHQRKRMEERQKLKLQQVDPSLTFMPKTNHTKRRTRTGPKTRPGPPCTIDLVLSAVIDAMSSDSVNKFELYTSIITQMLAPIVIPASPSLPTNGVASNDERFKRLYDDSIQRRKVQRERQEQESKKKLYSFAPKINKTSSHVAAGSQKEERFNRLYKDAELRKAKFAKTIEEKAKKSDHSFTPHINKSKNSSNNSQPPGSRFQQLYADGKKKREKRHAEIKQRREEVVRQREDDERVVPQKPQKNSKKRKKRQRPEVDQANATVEPPKISKVRQRSMDQKKNNAEMSKAGKSPRTKTKRKKKKKQEPPNLPGSYSKNAVAKYRERLAAHRQAAECTFSPKINKRSGQQGDDGTVFDRLQKETKAKYERIKQRELQLPHNCSFKPSVNPGPSRDGSVFSRLSEESKKRIERKKNCPISNDPACTFRPNLQKSSGSATVYSPKRPSGQSNNRKPRPDGARTLKKNDKDIEQEVVPAAEKTAANISEQKQANETTKNLASPATGATLPAANEAAPAPTEKKTAPAVAEEAAPAAGKAAPAAAEIAVANISEQKQPNEKIRKESSSTGVSEGSSTSTSRKESNSTSGGKSSASTG